MWGKARSASGSQRSRRDTHDVVEAQHADWRSVVVEEGQVVAQLSDESKGARGGGARKAVRAGWVREPLRCVVEWWR